MDRNRMRTGTTFSSSLPSCKHKTPVWLGRIASGANWGIEGYTCWAGPHMQFGWELPVPWQGILSWREF